MSQKVYIVPVKKACNANCKFCISKETASNSVQEMMNLSDPTVLKNLQNSLSKVKKMGINKIEVTGGGEPFLNRQLQSIINQIRSVFPNAFLKLYSNGFLLTPIQGVDELNISRSHHNSLINNKIYQSKYQNDLLEALSFFRPMVPRLRVCTVMLKDIMDSSEEYLKMINHLDGLVDEFVLRPLIPEKTSCLPMQANFTITHPLVKIDEIDCHCSKHMVIAPNGLIYEDFSFRQEYQGD